MLCDGDRVINVYKQLTTAIAFRWHSLYIFTKLSRSA